MLKTDDRKIYCKGCGRFLGYIRDATLKKEMVYLCGDCDTRMMASDLFNKTEKAKNNPFSDLFNSDLGGIFK